VLTYVNQCGHFPWLEQPDAFRRILTEFFTSAAREK
jgi:pimeloyl-ACP methyl ester carboxylesterase